MAALEGETLIRDYALERLTMLSDGVFAIAMTLLALDLRPPETWNHTFGALLDGLVVPFQAFFWGFFAAACFWLAHRRLFSYYRRADGPLTFATLLLLGQITLIPVATRILAGMQYSKASLILYIGLFTLVGCTNAASWLYATARPHIVAAPIGAARRLAVALIQCTIPVGMTTLGVLSPLQGLHWLPLLMPLLILAAYYLRVVAVAYDNRHAAARVARATP